MHVRAYLRASTNEQDATRALADLQRFAADHGLTIVSKYVENESGASPHRPELFRLLADSLPGDVLLIEQVDRLSRLNAADWDALKAQLLQKRVRVVALDLPTSWQFVRGGEEVTQRIMEAVNSMMLDMLAAIARKDYEDRRRRAAQGIVKAKAEGKYRGRPEDVERNSLILTMLNANMSWADVIKATGASRSTLARIKKAATAS